MKAKRLVSFVTTSALLFTMVAPAVAATVDEAYGRLNALNVAKGYTDGTIGADKNITRAEFAAVAVRLLGMEAAVNAAKGTTKFKDVASSHWAAGYINLAVGNGIIKGYPNGTFKPEANVSYAEATAMLVRVLGYEPQVTGTWPTNYVGKGAQLGLLDGITATDFNAAATRGNVFLAADNALDTNILKATKDGYEEDTTLMEKKLSVVKKVEGVVTMTPNYGDKKKVTIDPTPGDATNSDAYTVTTIDSLNGNEFWGEKVQAWVKDDKAIFFDRKNSSDVINDKVVADDTTATDLYLDAKDKAYGYSTTVKARINFNVFEDVYAKNALDVVADGAPVKVILDSAGKVAYAEVFQYTQDLVKDVNVADEKITNKIGSSLEIKDDIYTIVKNGKVVGVSDIKTNDVLDYVKDTGSTRFYIYATDKTATGKVDSYVNDGTTNYKVTIAGTTYKTTALQVSTNSGDTFGAAIGDVVGKTVTARLNKDGKIAFIVADAAAASDEFPVIVKAIGTTTGGSLDASVGIKIAKNDGTNTTYDVNKDTKINGTKVISDSASTTQKGLKAATPVITTHNSATPDDDKTVSATELWKVSLTTDGKVKEFKSYVAGDVYDGAANGYVVSKDNMTIAGYKANTDTKFAYADGDDYKAMTWANFKSMVDGSNHVASAIKLVIDKGIIKSAFLTTAGVSVASDWKYGVVTALGNDSVLDDFTEVNIAGTLTKIKGRQTGIAKEDLIEFKIDADNELDAATVQTVYSEYVVLDYNTTDKLLKVKNVGAADSTATWNKFVYDKDVMVFDGTDVKSITDLKDKTIRAFDVVNADDEKEVDGAFDFILIQ